MEILNDYFSNINSQIRSHSILNIIKIITIDDEESDEFIIYKDSKLSSQSLIKLLNLNSIDKDYLYEMMIESSEFMKSKYCHIFNTSLLLREQKIYFNLNPYNNFLSKNSNSIIDIRKFIRNITGNRRKNIDFENKVNPYGLERVVFTGGGTKGTIYMGTFLGLLSVGSIFYLNHFTGTSIGALTAMVFGCATPSKTSFNRISRKTIKQIINTEQEIVNKYRRCVSFIIEKFFNRTVETFYTEPNYSFYGMLSAFDKIVNNNGLFDFDKSGFKMWYALLCKKICKIMDNDLYDLIKIKKDDGEYIEFNDKIHCQDDIYFEQEKYDGWILESFFSFDEYNQLTDKTLVFTGTKTDPIETVLYTHTNPIYKNLDVILGATASMSIPWIFKAPIINKSYHLDGGIYDNYPLTNSDQKENMNIVKYHNKTFGYWIDDKNSMIDTYEIMRELYMVYDGFLNMTKINDISDNENFINISELFFKIRLDVFNLLFYPETEIKCFLNDKNEINEFNFNSLRNIISDLRVHSENSELIDFKFIKMDVNIIKKNLEELINFDFAIGKKTKFSNILEICLKQSYHFYDMINYIKYDLEQISTLKIKIGIIQKYEVILINMMKYILSYYEIKSTHDLSLRSNNRLCKYFLNNIKDLHLKLEKINNLIPKCDLKISIDIAMATTTKILSRASSNDIDISNTNIQNNKSSYQKAIDYFFHTDMTGILYNYMCIANDKVCNDEFNRMRTIRLNTFETSILHFNMSDELRCRLIYEGYSKTIKYFTSILSAMELTELERTEEFVESLDVKFKKMI